MNIYFSLTYKDPELGSVGLHGRSTIIRDLGSLHFAALFSLVVSPQGLRWLLELQPSHLHSNHKKEEID